MGRRLVAFLTMGAVAAGIAAFGVLPGGPQLRAEGLDQGSAEAIVGVPAPRPETSSALGLFNDVEVAGSWTGHGSHTVETLEVGSGDTLIAMLVGAGGLEPDATRAVDAISSIFNPRRLQVGQVVTAVFGTGTDAGSGELTAVSLDVGETDYVIASRTTDGEFVAHRSNQPLEAALVAPVEAVELDAGGQGVREREVRRGDTLMRLVVREGIGRVEADLALQALSKLFDPADLQVGQRLQIVVSTGPTVSLVGLGLQTGESSYVIVERDAAGDFVARRSEQPAIADLPDDSGHGPEIAPMLAGLDVAGATVETLVIGRDDTLMDLIVDAGATITEAHEAARNLGRHFDPRRLQIGQTVYVVRMPGPTGSGLEVLGLVVLDGGDEGIVAVTRNPDGEGFTGQRIEDLSAIARLVPGLEVDSATGAAEGVPPVALTDFGPASRTELLTAGRGDTLTSLLTRAGATRVEADKLMRAIRPHYDPRRLQIGQEVRVVFESIEGEGETLVSVSVKLKDNLYVQADLQGSGFVAQRTTTPLNPSFTYQVIGRPAEDATDEADTTDADEEQTVAAAQPPIRLDELPLPVSAYEAERSLGAEAEQVWFETKSGDTIATLLRELTSNGKEIAAVTDAFDAEFDPRSLRVGQQLVVITDKDAAGTHIVAVSLAIDNGGTLVVVRQPNSGYNLRRASSHVDLSDFALLEEPAEEDVPAVPDMLAVWPEVSDTLETATVEIASGGTLMQALLDLGIDNTEAHAAIDSMRNVFNPRSIQAGQTVEVTHVGTQLFGFTFVARPGERIEVAVGDSEFVAREVILPLEQSLEAARGSIRTSLYQAAEEAGVPPSVLTDLIRAYSFDVDFQREIRTGDTFDVLYETFRDEDGNVVRYGTPLYAVLNVAGVTLPIYRYTPESGFTDYFNDKGESVRKALLRTPVDGAKITSGFGMRDHPLLGYSRMHKGVDFGAPQGTPILAAGDGTIDFIGTNSGYGKYIRIRHNSTYMTAYAHMSGYADGLSDGSRVRQGQVIGYVGSTGQSTGPHLHYEVLVNGEQINPLDIKLPSGEVLAGAELERFYRERDALDAQYAEVRAQSYVAELP